MTTARAYGGRRSRKPKPYDPDAWSTPQWLFDELDNEFGFTLDVCASPENRKCIDYISATKDGLADEWHRHYAHDPRTGGPWAKSAAVVAFMNPPYSQIAKWLAKALDETAYGVTTVALVKADTSTKWWHEWYPKADEVRFLKRIQFVPPPGYDGKVGNPNMGHAVLIFRGAK